MTTKQATVIIPTFDHGPTIQYAIDSVLKQTIQDIEVFVIGDGAPEITRQIVTQITEKDHRVQYFEFPKDVRNGEIYRHQLITEKAKGKIICYLSDDDLWLPHHIELMIKLLKEADFAHTLPALCFPNNQWQVFLADFSQPRYQEYILKVGNRVPFPNMGHTLAMYKRLPYGWRTTPKGTPTDLYMYRQILQLPGVVVAAGFQPTVMHFPSSKRIGWSLEQRLSELSEFHAILNNDRALNNWLNQLIEITAGAASNFEHRLFEFDQYTHWPIRYAINFKQQVQRWWRSRLKT